MSKSTKWESFHYSYSPVKAGTIDTGAHNLIRDWTRLALDGSTMLNGKPLIETAKAYMKEETVDGKTTYSFESEDKIEQFFKEKILNKIPEENIEQGAKFLRETFHQGGLMYPVSAPLTEVLKNKKGQAFMMAASFSDKLTKNINIVTNEHGFKVQEIYSVKEASIPPENEDDPFIPEVLKHVADKDTGQIFPDKGYDYVIKAQAVIDVDFSDIQQPKITVESNHISYGNSAVKQAMDNRSLGQIIIDFFKYIFGANNVQNLSEIEPDSSETHETTLKI